MKTEQEEPEEVTLCDFCGEPIEQRSITMGEGWEGCDYCENCGNVEGHTHKGFYYENK